MRGRIVLREKQIVKRFLKIYSPTAAWNPTSGLGYSRFGNASNDRSQVRTM